jgi:radical SAM superfamily enzyme YgiQ (UPF0313 family)
MIPSAQLAGPRARSGRPKLRLINPRSPLTTITMPEIIQKMTFSRRALFMPLNLAICARVADDAGWDVEIIDENITDGLHVARADVDAVGIGAMTTQARRAYEIGDAYLGLNVPVILGGIHPSALPQEALAHATVVCKGDAEATLPYALNDLREIGSVSGKRIYDWADHPDSPIVTPRKDLLDPKQYLVFNPIQTTRGCPHGCTFCTTPAIFGRKFRQRAIPDIVEEMREAKERFKTGTFIFSDDDVAGNHAWAMELFEAITPLKIRWASQCDILISRNDKLLAAMRASGCQGIILGLESPNAATLRQAGKRYVNADEYHDRIRKIQSYRISIWGSFIFGFDTDNWRNCMETVRFAQRAGLSMSCYPILTPYPGTAVYQQYLAQGRLLTQDWDKYNGATVVFQPERMTVEELRYAQLAAFHEFYKPSSAMRRLKIWPLKKASWLANMAIYRGLTYYYGKKGRALPYFSDYIEPDARERISRGLGLTSRGRNGKFATATAK